MDGSWRGVSSSRGGGVGIRKEGGRGGVASSVGGGVASRWGS